MIGLLKDERIGKKNWEKVIEWVDVGVNFFGDIMLYALILSAWGDGVVGDAVQGLVDCE